MCLKCFHLGRDGLVRVKTRLCDILQLICFSIAVILCSAPSHWLCIDFLDFILCLPIQSSAGDKEPGITTSNPAVSTGLVLYLLEFWSSPRGSRSAALKILDSSHLPCLAHITKLFPSGKALGSCWMEQSQAMNLSCWWAFSPWSYTPK